MRILLVDDSTTMRNIQRKVLAGMGHNDIAEAADGLQALAAFNAQRPDLMLVDWNMPNMDGLTLIKSLRATPSYKTVPILMLTTESGEAMKAQGKAAGATGWLVKPFDPQKLLDVVKKVIG